ncbi:UDP-glycosyltransferase 73C4-like [Mangifera indica]|uniref:UDP-glycosyltransferase 73C4-like n=1 Tax=Mangifera indica TaxID=29780 RepID=UPI001CFBA355|nr:UDP-glycosyltransferase 73C4-like [Mangifera indica]
MSSQVRKLHFILFPLMAQGHMIPMIDLAKLLAGHGAIITIITTPVNAARLQTVLAHAARFKLQIQLSEVQFPCQEAGLPEGCESFDMLPSMDLAYNFFKAISMVQFPVEILLEKLTIRPSCIISDLCFPWTIHTAAKFNVPRIDFPVFSCFYLLCMRNLRISKILESVNSDSKYFLVPDLPDQIAITKAQLPGSMPQENRSFGDEMIAAEMASYGVIINTFEELESAYVKEFKKAKRGKVWCIGPVSLCSNDNKDKNERGNKASIDEFECLKWLDICQPSSVLYVCLGSLYNLASSQLIELGLALEASKKQFIWVIKGGNKSTEFENWLEKFEERIKGRGLLIKGWAPQVLILSHPAIGGFLTHCGWNSIQEGISAGVPMVTWPLFGDQFCNEKLVVQVLKIGVSTGVEFPVNFGQEEKVGVLLKKEDIEKAIRILMVEGDERRIRVKEFAEMAKRAITEGGSSYLNVKMLFQDIMQQVTST